MFSGFPPIPSLSPLIFRFLESMLPSHTYLQLHINPVNPASVSTPAQKLLLAKSQRPPCCSIQEQFFRSHVTNVRPPGALFSSLNFLGFCTHCKNHIHNKTSQATTPSKTKTVAGHPILYSISDFYVFIFPSIPCRISTNFFILLPFFPFHSHLSQLRPVTLAA